MMTLEGDSGAMLSLPKLCLYPEILTRADLRLTKLLFTHQQAACQTTGAMLSSFQIREAIEPHRCFTFS